MIAMPAHGNLTPTTNAWRGDAAAPLGIYVHWPFCRSKCPYCDFNSHVREAIDEDRWRAALLAELDHAARTEAPGRSVGSVFFGGGTPSLMAPSTVGALLERIGARFALRRDVEISLEANPTSVESRNFQGYRAAGVDRVSIGVQALDDAALAFLGRRHSSSEALKAIEQALARFPRASLDLIYARPGQTPRDWRAELGRALAIGTEHISLYQLTIEPGTRFHTLNRLGRIASPDEDAAWALWEVTQEATEGAGLPAYEVSNHARPGAECRHNLVYWRAGDWIGIGPGAHGRIGQGTARRAVARARAPEAWLKLVDAKGHGTVTDAALPASDIIDETLMMGLRLAEGIDRARFETTTGVALDDAVPPDRAAPLIEAGLIESDARGLRATPRGRAVLNAVLARLAA
jgi:oxygen-independent coproporphyrinogen-3 oxidase